MRGEGQTMLKTSSQSQQCHEFAMPESMRKICKRHQDSVKLAWSENSSPWIHFGSNVASDRQCTQRKSNASQHGVDKKDGNRIKSILQGNDAMKLIASKTRGFRRSFSESFKLRTVVKAYRDGASAATEEIADDVNSSSGILKPDEFIYRPHAPNARRKAICDEIEKCIVQNGGTLRSLRRDLVVAVNLTNWHLL